MARAVILSAALAFYCTFVGGDVPVLRATVMAAVVLVGRTLDLDGDAANLLGLAALLLLAQRPSSIGDVGFQLSFAATLGLVLLTPPVMRWMPALPFGAEVALASSLGAQAALGPLLAYHFHRLAPAALLLNLVAVPLSGAVLLAGFAILAASAVAPALVSSPPPWPGRARGACSCRARWCGWPPGSTSGWPRPRSARPWCRWPASPLSRGAAARARPVGGGHAVSRLRLGSADAGRPAAGHLPRRRAGRRDRDLFAAAAAPGWSTPGVRSTRGSTWGRR